MCVQLHDGAAVMENRESGLVEGGGVMEEASGRVTLKNNKNVLAKVLWSESSTQASIIVRPLPAVVVVFVVVVVVVGMVGSPIVKL